LVECIAEQSSTISSQADKAVTDSNIIESQIYLFGDDLSIITSQAMTIESQAVTIESQAMTIESQAVTIASQEAGLAQLDAEYDALNESAQRLYQEYLRVCRNVQNMKEYIREIEHQNEQLELLIQAMEEAAAEAADEPC
jgi:cell division protein FtsB